MEKETPLQAALLLHVGDCFFNDDARFVRFWSSFWNGSKRCLLWNV